MIQETKGCPTDRKSGFLSRSQAQKEKEKEMLDYKLIGKRIRECRENAGISQELLAEWAELSPSYISRIENGKKHVSLESLTAIADVLRISLDYLVYGGSQEGTVQNAPIGDLLTGLTKAEALVIRDTLTALLNGLRAYLC